MRCSADRASASARKRRLASVSVKLDKAPRSEDGLPTLGLTLRSANRETLGDTAVKIRSLRPPEPYKGKGIKYAEERVRRKEGKTGTA